MNHVHKCKCCGREFEHNTASRIPCPFAGSDWTCNACYLSRLYESDKSQEEGRTNV